MLLRQMFPPRGTTKVSCTKFARHNKPASTRLCMNVRSTRGGAPTTLHNIFPYHRRICSPPPGSFKCLNKTEEEKQNKKNARHLHRLPSYISCCFPEGMALPWKTSKASLRMPHELQSKPSMKMVYPNQCKELQRRPQLNLAETVPY